MSLNELCVSFGQCTVGNGFVTYTAERCKIGGLQQRLPLTVREPLQMQRLWG